jgi:Ni/Co efflux regulator RcnB
MKAKLIKILVISAVFAFFSAGVSMAQERRGGRQNTVKAKAYSHYKQDKNHKVEHDKNLKKYDGHKHYPTHYSCPQCRPVVLRHHHHQYSTYRNYRPTTGIIWILSVVDPNMAFSIGVKGR